MKTNVTKVYANTRQLRKKTVKGATKKNQKERRKEAKREVWVKRIQQKVTDEKERALRTTVAKETVEKRKKKSRAPEEEAERLGLGVEKRNVLGGVWVEVSVGDEVGKFLKSITQPTAGQVIGGLNRLVVLLDALQGHILPFGNRIAAALVASLDQWGASDKEGASSVVEALYGCAERCSAVFGPASGPKLGEHFLFHLSTQDPPSLPAPLADRAAGVVELCGPFLSQTTRTKVEYDLLNSVATSLTSRHSGYAIDRKREACLRLVLACLESDLRSKPDSLVALVLKVLGEVQGSGDARLRLFVTRALSQLNGAMHANKTALYTPGQQPTPASLAQGEGEGEGEREGGEMESDDDDVVYVPPVAPTPAESPQDDGMARLGDLLAAQPAAEAEAEAATAPAGGAGGDGAPAVACEEGDLFPTIQD